MLIYGSVARENIIYARQLIINKIKMQKKKLKKQIQKIKFKKPTTKLEDLVEFYKDIKAEENLIFVRTEAEVLDGKKAFSSLKEQWGKIIDRYSKKLDPKDQYFFETINELKNFLKSVDKPVKWNKKEIEETIEHEKAHYQRIIKEGYKPGGFICWLALDKKEKIGYVISTRMALGKIIKYETRKKVSAIARAPKNPSYIDRMSYEKKKINKKSKKIK